MVRTCVSVYRHFSSQVDVGPTGVYLSLLHFCSFCLLLGSCCRHEVWILTLCPNYCFHSKKRLTAESNRSDKRKPEVFSLLGRPGKT